MASIASLVENNCKDDSARAKDAAVSKSIAKAPGKLILSGEHAVVYGAPSIAMAIDLYATSEVSRNKQNLLGFDFANLKYNAKHTLHTISKLKDKAFVDYHRFLHGECSIREVVNKPFELLQFAVSNFLDKLNIVLPGGIDIKTNSTIPHGCGLGSSAATIMSLLYAVGDLLDLNITKARYIELGKAAENLQHGKSSGVDINLTVEGGCLRFANGDIKPIRYSSEGFYLVNTGRPVVTTGECVNHVKKHFKNSKLIYDFESITLGLERSLLNNNTEEVARLVRENHILLNHIGIVPERVNEFILRLNNLGVTAKVCGAGAVKGDNAGAVLIICQDPHNLPNVKDLLNKHGYTMQAVNVDNHGIKVI